MTKSEKIKVEIERMMKYFQQEKDALPITNETRTDRFSLGARISMCEELLEYINEIPDDEPQQPQPKIRYPFAGGIVDNCVAKCWEPGGVCTNPHRDCIDCPKDWNLGFNTYTSNKIEGNLSADPKDRLPIKPKISEDTAWNTNIKGACKLSVAPEVKCGEVCDHCISQPICDKPEKCNVKVKSLPKDTHTTTWDWTENELMVGDWVRLVKAYGNTQDDIMIVDALDLYRISQGDYEVEPVPLTAEMLIDNGFVEELDDNNTHYRYTLTMGSTQFSLKYARSVFQWMNQIDIKYVHKLQNIMKICGIDKYIIL